MKTKSCLSWFGSDSEVAGQLAAMLDHCSHVTIPFVGGAAIIPHLSARAIVACDLHRDAINFYRVLRGRYGEVCRSTLIEMCKATLSHPDELRMSNEILTERLDYTDETARSWAFWVRCWLPRKGQGGTVGDPKLPSVRWTANGGTNASRIQSVAGDLDAWSKQFQRVEFDVLDFGESLPKVKDLANCGIYVDAPWVDQGGKYAHPFTELDHVELAGCLERFSAATVVVRYGDSELIRRLYPESVWNWTDAASRTQTNAVKSEVWITNRKIEYN